MKNTVSIPSALPSMLRAVTHIEQFERRDRQLRETSPAYYQMCAATATELLEAAPSELLAQMPLSLAMSELVEALHLEERLVDNRAKNFPVLDALMSRLTLPSTRPDVA